MFFRSDMEHVISQVGPSWLKLKNKKIFITGGKGFIGKWLIGSILHANTILNLNCNITVLTRNSDKFKKNNKFITNNPAITIVENDIRILNNNEKKYDYIIHAATDVAEQISPLETFEVCTIGTKNILDFGIKCQCSNLLLLSSGAVYGRQPNSLSAIPESFNGMPERNNQKSAYGLGKIASEWYASEYSRNYNINITIARCFAFVGPYLPMDKNFAIGNFIKSAITNNNIIINGDGSPIRTYLYAGDLASWLWKILLEGSNGDIYNVGGEHQISIEELAKLVRYLLNKDITVRIMQEKNKNIIIERYVPDVNLIKNKFNIHSVLSLEESIEKTAKWYMEFIKK